MTRLLPRASAIAFAALVLLGPAADAQLQPVPQGFTAIPGDEAGPLAADLPAFARNYRVVRNASGSVWAYAEPQGTPTYVQPWKWGAMARKPAGQAAQNYGVDVGELQHAPAFGGGAERPAASVTTNDPNLDPEIRKVVAEAEAEEAEQRCPRIPDFSPRIELGSFAGLGLPIFGGFALLGAVIVLVAFLPRRK